MCTSTGLSSWDQSSPSKKTHSELNWLKKISLTPFLNHSVHQNWLVACTVTHSNITMQWDPKVRWTFYQFLYTIFLLIVVTSFPFSFQIISLNFTTEVENVSRRKLKQWQQLTLGKIKKRKSGDPFREPQSVRSATSSLGAITRVSKENNHRSKFFHWEWGQFVEFISPVIYCDDHSSPLSTTAVHIWIISLYFHSRHFTPHGRYELNKLTSLHSSVGRASYRHFEGVTGSNPVDALIFSGFFFPVA